MKVEGKVMLVKCVFQYVCVKIRVHLEHKRLARRVVFNCRNCATMEWGHTVSILAVINMG